MKDSLPETGQPSQTGGSVRCRMSVPAGRHDAESLRPAFAGKQRNRPHNRTNLIFLQKKYGYGAGFAADKAGLFSPEKVPPAFSAGGPQASRQNTSYLISM